MELLFGVIGRGPHVGATVSRLAAYSTSSNPGTELVRVTDGYVALGHAVRRFATLSGDDPRLVFHLDGEIRSIAGVDVSPDAPHEELYRRLAAEYRVDSDRFWRRLDGSYCLVVREDRICSVGVDVAGTRGVYWWSHDGILAFHSHLADLAPTFPGSLSEDSGALASFLASGIYPPRRTAFGEVAHLGAGQYLRFEDGQPPRARDHLSMVYEQSRPASSRPKLVEELIELIGSSVAAAATWMQRPVVPLSGGLDSRYLLAELARHAPDPSAIATITWGEDRERPDSDAQVAPGIAAAIGASNTWFEKSQQPSPKSFARAIYLSSGEADCAIHFPDDHGLHALLARNGYSSLLRGDECFGNGPTLLTRQAALAVNGIGHLKANGGYAVLIEPSRLKRMADAQEGDLAAMMTGVRSATATGARDEIRYAMVVRRVLASYNRVKHTDLEVYTPFLARPILEWLRATPDSMRFDKRLLREALARRFPHLAAIPFATRSNLPDWNVRWRHDPALVAFYQHWCDTPGWLEAIGSQASILGELNRMALAASRPLPPLPGSDGLDWKAVIKRTLPGRALREMTIARRYHASGFERISRLAVLHRLIGDVEQRRTESGPPGPSHSGLEPTGGTPGRSDEGFRTSR